MPAAPAPVAEEDLGPFSRFVSRSDSTDDSSSPNDGDYGPFRGFVPEPSVAATAAPPPPSEDLGVFSRFVPTSPTPRADAAFNETDDLDQRLAEGQRYLEEAQRNYPNRTAPVEGQQQPVSPSVPQTVAMPNIVALRSGKIASSGEMAPEITDQSLVALAHGTVKGGGAMGAGIGAAAALEAPNATVSAFTGPAAPITMAGLNVLEFLGGMLLANKAIDKGEEAVRPHSEVMQQIHAAVEAHPTAEAVGEELPMIPLLARSVKGFYDIAQTAETAGEAARKIGGRVAGGAAAGAVMETARPHVENLINAAGQQMGFAPEQVQQPTVRSYIENAAIGAILGGQLAEEQNLPERPVESSQVAPDTLPPEVPSAQVETATPAEDAAVSVASEPMPQSEMTVAEPFSAPIESGDTLEERGDSASTERSIGGPDVSSDTSIPAPRGESQSDSGTAATEPQAIGAGLQGVPATVQEPAEIAAPPASLGQLEEIPNEKAAAVEAVSADPAQKQFVAGMAEQARASLGPGAASVDEFPLLRAENAREYAAIGAAHLLEGNADKPGWISAMREEYGVRDATTPELNKIWRDSHDLLADFHAAQTGKALAPKAQIEQATGIRPALASMKARVSDSISKAQGLGEYLRGMEKGSALGATTKARQLRIADKWLAADQEQVRRTMTEFVNKVLPPSERGRFVGAITRALKRPDLVRGDPAIMYRNAFRVMQAIENRTEDVHRGNLIADIKKISGRILDSPSVDLAAKRILQRTLREINLRTPQKATAESLGKTREFLNRMAAAGQEVLMPQKVLASLEQLQKRPIQELPTTAIEDLHTKVRLAEKIGQMRFKTRGAQWSAEKKMRLDELKAGDGSPLEMRELFRPQPGERLSLGERVRNWTARRFNAATAFDLGHLPVDVHFDLLQGGKGTYSGPLFDHIRNPIDAAYDRAQYRAMQELDPLREIIKRNKLSDTDEDLIGLWAQLQQEGGEARAIESGVTKATIDKLKASGLTKAQKEAYDYMRGRLDATLPEVQSLMHDLFNIDVEAVENYFPWMRAWESFKPSADRPVFDARTGAEVSPEMLDSFGKLAGDFALRDTTKLQRGFTIDRLEGAKTPIRTDSFDVFQRHMYAASRLIEMQRDLKMAGEVIRDDAFAKKFGAYGQRMLNQWLTAVATDGRGNNVHRIPLLDMARRGSNRALVFFRLTSNIKHLSAVPQAIVNSGGPEYFFRGLHALASKDGQAFLQNFPQVTERQAGDMSLQELQRSLGNTPSGLFPKGLAMADRFGFVLGKEIDAVNSRAVFLGRYLRNLEDRGIKTGLSGPVDQAAASNALVFMRRTVSSTLAKDVQPVLGRGQGFGGNVSVARTMNAFRQYALERWSLLRYDTPAAFRSGNYTRGVALLAAAVAAGLYETNVASALRRAGAALAGHDDANDKEHESWLQRLMVDTFSMVPYANNVVSAVQWGESGIPLVENFVGAGKAVRRVADAKTEEGKKSAAIGAVGAAAQLSGVPGSGVATSLARNALVDREKMKREAAHSRRTHHGSSR